MMDLILISTQVGNSCLYRCYDKFSGQQTTNPME
ncbi:conserved protein of unknown function [Ectopseudomonas oleovorans]|uniref:Uncharacterized protein n=1 Tax=Ectopseudomonas oleovorans TaxID=301 RepID=A0A653B059_ECTOL|nr:conserved protein of unknown function [Pseudomonas oleovorans]